MSGFGAVSRRGWPTLTEVRDIDARTAARLAKIVGSEPRRLHSVE
jgi:hypothetical protein